MDIPWSAHHLPPWVATKSLSGATNKRKDAAPQITAAQSAVVYKIRVHHFLCRPVEAVVWKSVHPLRLLREHHRALAAVSHPDMQV